MHIDVMTHVLFFVITIYCALGSSAFMALYAMANQVGGLCETEKLSVIEQRALMRQG